MAENFVLPVRSNELIGPWADVPMTAYVNVSIQEFLDPHPLLLGMINSGVRVARVYHPNAVSVVVVTHPYAGVFTTVTIPVVPVEIVLALTDPTIVCTIPYKTVMESPHFVVPRGKYTWTTKPNTTTWIAGKAASTWTVGRRKRS